MNTTSTSAGDFIRVPVAKKKYFGGVMSLRWWYKQIETGRLPHFRAGATVLLRPADVEAFVAETFRDRGEAGDEPEPPAEPPSPPPRPRSTSGRGGLRFFK
jgi:hypothetical protein